MQKQNDAEVTSVQETHDARPPERRNFVALAFPALLGVLAACGGKSRFGSQSKSDVSKTTKVDDPKPAVGDDNSVGSAPQNDDDGFHNSVLNDLPTFTEEPTPGIPTVTPVATVFATPTEAPTVAPTATPNPLAEFEKIKIPTIVTDLIKTVKLYGSASAALIALELNNAKEGDFVHIVRKSSSSDKSGTVLSTKRLSAADLISPVVFDNIRLQGASALQIVYQKASCGDMTAQEISTDSGIFINTRTNASKGDSFPVIDASKLMDAPYPGYFENMPYVETANPSSPKGYLAQKGQNRAYNVATMDSTWGPTKFVAADGKPRVFEYTDVLGNPINPADSKFFLNTNLLIVYFFNKDHYYRYFYYFG